MLQPQGSQCPQNVPLSGAAGVKRKQAAISLIPAGTALLILSFDILVLEQPWLLWAHFLQSLAGILTRKGWRILSICYYYFLFLSPLNSTLLLTVKTQQEPQISRVLAHSNWHQFVCFGAEAGVRKPGL